MPPKPVLFIVAQTSLPPRVRGKPRCVIHRLISVLSEFLGFFSDVIYLSMLENTRLGRGKPWATFFCFLLQVICCLFCLLFSFLFLFFFQIAIFRKSRKIILKIGENKFARLTVVGCKASTFWPLDSQLETEIHSFTESPPPGVSKYHRGPFDQWRGPQALASILQLYSHFFNEPLCLKKNVNFIFSNLESMSGYESAFQYLRTSFL